MTLIFREGLLALIPIADKARLHWREPNNYDDWDSIAQSLFHSIVISSLEYAGEWTFPHKIPEYDVRIADYSQNSFLSISTRPTELAFIRFETNLSPFDTALFARLDVTGKVLRLEREHIDRLHFILSGRSTDSIVVIDDASVHL